MFAEYGMGKVRMDASVIAVGCFVLIAIIVNMQRLPVADAMLDLLGQGFRCFVTIVKQCVATM